MRILAAQINPTIGDIQGNSAKIIQSIHQAKTQSADLILFPEMALCGYPPEDFLLLSSFCDAVEHQLDLIVAASKGIVVVLGTIRRTAPGEGEKFLYNSAAVISDGQLLGFQDKALLPTYDVFDEARYFEPSKACPIWEISGKRIGITICEDIWQHTGAVSCTRYHRDPIEELALLKPDLLLNLSASPFSLERSETREALCRAVTKTLGCPIILCNQIGGNDSLIFDGNSLYINAKGRLLLRGKSFTEDALLIDTQAEYEPSVHHAQPMRDLHDALVLGLGDYFKKQGFTKAIVGLSGGIDSAIVACIAAAALGAANVLAVGMPSRFSSEGSIVDARALAEHLGIAFRIISIEEPFQSFLDLLAPEFEGMPGGVTEENMQSRIRGHILMALSNKFNYIVLATGNKSEMAMGYATLYGDMCGGVGVISDVTKQQVYALARWINRNEEIIPQSTLEKPPSAELKPHQLDTDSLPEYAVVDAVLEDYVENHLTPEQIAAKHGYALVLVEDLVKRIHRNEYKRRQAAPGLRISQKAFSVGRRFPIVQKWV